MQERGEQDLPLAQEPGDDGPRPGELVLHFHLQDVGQEADEGELLRGPFGIGAETF